MIKTLKSLKVCVLAIGLSAPLAGHAGVLFTNIFSFNGTNGAQPSILVPAGNHKIYGNTVSGGPRWNPSRGGIIDCGGIFSIGYDGAFSNLCFFEITNGYVGENLASGLDGNFYGTTEASSFRLNPNGTMANPHLTPGLTNVYGLVQDHDGTLYGTTLFDEPTNYGTIFKLDTNGVITTLMTFDSTNGAFPELYLLGPDNNFYGLTIGRSDFVPFSKAGYGTIFRLDHNGNFTNIYFFNSTNAYSPAWLTQGADGDLYGIDFYGGPVNGGTVFRITTNGALVWSVPFNGTNGFIGNFIAPANDGNLYGAAIYGGSNYLNSTNLGSGTIFRITPNGSLTALVQFDGTNDANPQSVVQGTDGNFYGTAYVGGTYGHGAIFKLSLPLQPSFTAITQSNSLITFQWTSVSGQTYQLQTNSDLSSTNWGNLGAPILATNGTLSASDSVGLNASLFYRLVLLP